MVDTLEEFIGKVEQFNDLSASEKCDYFVYFLTEIKGAAGVRPKDVQDCFAELRIRPYSNIPRYLSNNGRKPAVVTFLKKKELYLLERRRKEEINKTVKLDKPFIETNKTLRSLLPLIQNQSEAEFLDEAIKCFEVEAFRATIIMIWLLAIDHLYSFILANKQAHFNLELSKVTDRRVKVMEVKIKDDFSDIPEGKFIELCRASGIISNDVRKILDEKLGIRNSSAHPSSIKIGRGKAFEFIEDITNNVILKY